MDNTKTTAPAYSKAGLIWRFLRGSKRYFAIAVLSAAVIVMTCRQLSDKTAQA